ncbi:DUF4333 domain-containing protein [Propionibacteriaceae bacterium G1746]|uniref:DUF4333 domain-containing protein n=1 Tax=Aestuariimicrobium sp. G57 TaxID=3418485 RepID=UPI003C1D0C60
MAFCTQCGGSLTATSKFCGHCGTPVFETPDSPALQHVEPMPVGLGSARASADYPPHAPTFTTAAFAAPAHAVQYPPTSQLTPSPHQLLQPPRPSHAGIWVAAVLAAVLLIFIGAIAWSNRAPTLNTDEVETTIQRKMYLELQTPVTINCPRSPRIEAGSSFRCNGDIRDTGLSFIVLVRMLDDEGAYTWEVLR